MKKTICIALSLLAMAMIISCALAETWVEITKAGSIRNAASFDGDRIVLAQAGERYEYLGEINGWYKVTYDGQTGYVSANYIA